MRRLLATLLLVLMPAFAAAQGAATLVADNVTIPADGGQLIASGNVEVFYDGTRLSAARIIFDQAADRLIIQGPIFIQGPNGEIFTASQADLDPRLQNGILRGARLVLDQQLQLAANQIDRVGGRYTQLYQVAATSCHICQNGGTPLWEIRAQRVVHDTDEGQLYFDNAQLRVGGVPVFWVPRMRLPDPTVTRSTGFLIPGIRTTDLLGAGIKLPYFIRLGDHRDLTLTPYFSRNTSTLEATYRQAFLRGEIQIDAAISHDTIVPGNRRYLFGRGQFDLANDYRLRFDVEAVTDTAYLLDYGYSDKDRLDSAIGIFRVRDRDMAHASLTYYDTLRAGEVNETLPPLLIDAAWERRYARLGGTLTLNSDIQGHYRGQPETLNGWDDATRLGFGGSWRGDHVTSYGLVLTGEGGLDLDYYDYSSASSATDTFRTTTYAAATLRYPMIRRSDTAVHVLEPTVQLAWSDVTGDPVANEDSTASEFDQTSLFALSRFAGEDAVESGARAAVGLRWTRQGNLGWDSTLTVGRVLREADDLAFSASSGLRNANSDWLIAGQLRTPAGFSIDGRAIVEDSFAITKSEARIGWANDRIDLAASYIYLPADLDESRPAEVSEWTIDTEYKFDETWTFGADARYDVASDDLSRAGLQVGWQNECVSVDFSVSRRFTSSTIVQPSTDFGLSVELKGFSAGRAASAPTHRCTD